MSRLYSDEAELYDIAFDWDVSAEVDWLLERLGGGVTSVLEPGCGTGRMLEALARRGLEVAGIDVSPETVAFARERLARAGLAGDVVLADMREFDLGRRFGGAVCPIGTLGHLDPGGLAQHLEHAAGHLEPGARYLVQLGLVGARDDAAGGSRWEAARADVRLRVTWEGVDRYLARGREVQRSRIEILSGPRAGEVVEELHEMALWTPEAWREAVAASPFAQVGCFDGNLPDRPPVEPEQGGGLLWHELVAP